MKKIDVSFKDGVFIHHDILNMVCSKHNVNVVAACEDALRCTMLYQTLEASIDYNCPPGTLDEKESVKTCMRLSNGSCIYIGVLPLNIKVDAIFVWKGTIDMNSLKSIFGKNTKIIEIDTQ